MTTVGLAGCVGEGSPSTATAIYSTHELTENSDGSYTIKAHGTAGYSCHSGFLDEMDILVEFTLNDEVVYDTVRTVETNSCGMEYDWAATYRISAEDAEGMYQAGADAEVIDRRADRYE